MAEKIQKTHFFGNTDHKSDQDSKKMDILDFLGHLKQFEKLENQSYWLFLEHNLILVNYPFSDPLYVLPHHTSSPNTSSPTPLYLSPHPSHFKVWM